MALTLLALFNLKEGMASANYLEWAKSVDIPTANGLKSVSEFSVYGVSGVFGSDGQPPYEYFEIIQVTNMDDFLADIGSETMQDIAAQFGQFTDDVIFLVSDRI